VAIMLLLRWLQVMVMMLLVMLAMNGERSLA
jgi:hypothetical protein